MFFIEEWLNNLSPKIGGWGNRAKAQIGGAIVRRLKPTVKGGKTHADTDAHLIFTPFFCTFEKKNSDGGIYISINIRKQSDKSGAFEFQIKNAMTSNLQALLPCFFSDF